MMKILKNQTASAITINDAGIVVPASGQYVIPSQDYLLWAASDNIVTRIGDGTIVVSDGSSDLSISQGTDLIKGIFPKHILGGTTNVKIGNTGDSLRVIDSALIGEMKQSAKALIFKSEEMNIASRNETDLSTTVYTVPAGKVFALKHFSTSYNTNASAFIRLRKQVGGTGAWTTVQRISLMSGGQGDSTTSINLGTGIVVGSAGDVFKITTESSLARGNIWAAFGGSELDA